MLSVDDTIAAIASAHGAAARGIVRISGPATIKTIAERFRSEEAIESNHLVPASVLFGHLVCDQFSIPADLFLWPTRRSYTRQPLAEIHTFGSPPVLDAILQGVCAAGARLAQPGEFTLRAFLAGRIDLTQAEAVLGVIDAADRRQLKAAIEQLAGGLSRPLQQLRRDLLNLLADLEAGLDFVEDDIRFVSTAELQNRLAAAAEQLQRVATQLSTRNAAGGLPRVALIGWPNVGKSCLFNALAGGDSAMVSPEPGTTRDYLTATIDAAGLPIELIDTAGISTEGLGTNDRSIDTAAQAASDRQYQIADLRILCLDSGRSLNSWEEAQYAIQSDLLVVTKCDQRRRLSISRHAIDTSSHNGLGLERLREAIRNALLTQSCESGVVANTTIRVGESIRLATECLTRAWQLVLGASGEELVAAELRTALVEIGKIVGTIYTDDLLDRIFSRFCIGK